MLSCKDMARKANDYIDQDLSLMSRLKFGMHLFMCVHCRNYVSQMRATIKVIKMRGSNEEECISEKEVARIVQAIQKSDPEQK